MERRQLFKLTSLALAGAGAGPSVAPAQDRSGGSGRGVWDEAFARARFVSLAHVLEPGSPV